MAWSLFNEWLPWVRRWLGKARFGQTAQPRWSRPPLPEWRGTYVVVLGTLIAALTLYAIQPPWWSDPIWGVQRFLDSNLSPPRSVPVPSLYLGKVYLYSLPWHNTIVLTAVTTPALVLVLGSLGIGSTLVRANTDREGVLWFLSWAVLMVVRALPIAPGHDVERLILPSLASLSILAGLGVGVLAEWLRGRGLGLIAPVLAGLAIGECVLGIVQTYPYNLSYYNPAVGGLAVPNGWASSRPIIGRPWVLSSSPGYASDPAASLSSCISPSVY